MDDLQIIFFIISIALWTVCTVYSIIFLMAVFNEFYKVTRE